MVRKLDPRSTLKVAPIERTAKGDAPLRLPEGLRQELLAILPSLEDREDVDLYELAKRWCSLFQGQNLSLPDALAAILTPTDPPVARSLRDRFALAVSQVWIADLEKGWQRLIEDQTLALQQANQQLRQIDRSRAEFVSTLSHELRTPLTAIFGYCELLLDDFQIPGEPLTFLKLIQSSAEHIHRLIDDVLDFSKLEAGKLELNLEPVDFAPHLDGVLELVRPLLLEKGLSFEQEGETEVLLADPVRLRQILLNLLSNAIKFTPEGGHVRIRIERTLRCRPEKPPQPMLAIEVIDDGIGISPEHQAEIFERFRQVRNPRAGTRGTGLGLPISRFLIELHGGTIEVKSKLGEGSSFRFTIPLAP